jgi:Zn-dependent protease
VIRFRALGIPLTIRPSFWLIALLIAPLPFSYLTRLRAYPFYLAWIGVVLVSVVAHELGHGLVARRLGARTEIVLYALGGYTAWSTEEHLGPWRRVTVAASGSVVGFVLGGGVWLLHRNGFSTDLGVATFAMEAFWRVNLLWGVLNWLPIRPLDGGHIFLGTLQGLFGRVGVRIADVVFPLFTVVAGWWAYSRGYVFAAFLALFVLAEEYRHWSARSATRRPRREPVDDGAGFSLFGEPEPHEPVSPTGHDGAPSEGAEPAPAARPEDGGAGEDDPR